MGQKGIRGTVMRDVPMKRYTSMRVGGQAPYLFYPEDEADLSQVILWLRERQLPFRFLGNGTNVIVADRGLAMGVIRVTRMGTFRARRTRAGALVEAGAGVALKTMIRQCAARGLSGLERLFGIPGTVGGALKMNAGSFGVSISDCLISVKLMDEEGEVLTRQRHEMGFGYRTSSFGDRECILEATFELKHADPRTIKAEMERVWRERLGKHPMEMASAGSVFRNRDGDPCWKYIDRAGLRGFSIGNASVSEKHPNFIVNRGGASASDVLRLIETVKLRVREATGVALEEEVELWGFNE